MGTWTDGEPYTDGTEDQVTGEINADRAADSQAASIDYGGSTNIAAATVEAALDELDAEKLALAGGTMTGNLSTTGIAITDTDGTGAVIAAVQATAPSNAPSGSAGLYVDKRAGRELWFQRASTGAARSVLQVPFNKTFTQITPQSSTSVRTIGAGAAATTAGTVSHPGATTNGYFTQLQQSTGGLSGSAYTGNVFERGAASDLGAGFFFHSRIYLPDASYNETGASTGCRINAGLFSGAMAATDRHTAANSVTFNRCSVNGGAIDTNWQFVASDGATAKTVDTGLAFTAQHVYDVFIWCPAGSSTIYGRIEDVTAGTSAEVSVAENLPGASTPMAAVVDLRTVDSVTRNLQFSRIYCESDKG